VRQHSASAHHGTVEYIVQILDKQPIEKASILY
jgi:hypothetical protein